LIKAFSSYVRSIYLQKDKEVFNVQNIPLEEFAESLGLPTVPFVKFVPGDKLKQAKNAPHPIIDSSDDERKRASSGMTKHEKISKRQNQTVLSKHYRELHSEGNTAFKVDDDDDEEEDIFSKKRKVDWDNTEIPTRQLPVSSFFSMLMKGFKTSNPNGKFKESYCETCWKRH
jgi:ATP-dependent RNA helicase DDX10/DBP4